ncbi:MAG: thioesterase family protein [Ekhidna sp.]|uniref:acyl-CoA thioesterase n=1 Tax=Ekhidna sp. TaxID=2608089 RepID=UPI0032ECECB3
MYTHETHIRVRYAETDKMGFVYYGNYPAYYEVARVEGFRALGFPYSEMEDAGVGMPVLDLSIKYHGPAKYDDLLTIKLIIPEMPRARMRFLYEIRNEAGDLVNTGETILAFMNMETGRPVKMPERMKESIAPFFE